MFDDDDFEPKLGKPRSRDGKRLPRRLNALRQATATAGQRTLDRAARRFDGSRIGRGAGVGRVLADRHAAFRSRRVVIKARIAKIAPRGFKAAGLHLRYLQRDGVTREGAPGQLYDAAEDRADGKAFLDRSREDRHQFRFIIAAEDGEEYEDLKVFTRQLMAQMEQDLGTKLDWVAVDHFNTGHPHTHVILRGKDEEGRDLIIAREYIAHGMRERAVEIATLDLGPRTDLEIETKLRQEMTQDRLTSIDRGLVREAGDEGLVSTALSATRDRFRHALKVGRLNHLEQLGLAEQVSDTTWRLQPGLDATLRRMGERDDIVRTMQRALTDAKLERGAAGYSIVRPDDLEKPLVGRLVARGLHDANDRHYIIVDGIDGRTHWVDIGRGDATEFLKRGAVVSIERRPAESLPSDRTIAAVSYLNGGVYTRELHRAYDRTASDEFITAHVRRLEALRRVGIGERHVDGTWNLPENFLEATRAHEAKVGRQAPVRVEILAAGSLQRLATADAATWLDRQLISESAPGVRDAGFGREVKAALAQRRQWLIEQGLAQERQTQIVYRAGMLAILRRRELARAAAQIAAELKLPYAQFSGAGRVAGKYVKRLDLVGGRFAVIERGRDFTLVPWRPALERSLGKTVSGIMRGEGISWETGRKRGPEVSV